jgi:hypothetical protein
VRTLNPSYLNEVANHSSVRPWLKGEGALDLAPLVSNPENIALQFDGGGWVLRSLGACRYEVHSMFLPEVRGAKVRDNLKEALEYVFLQTDAVKLVTQIPEGNVAARALARIAGFRLWFGEYHVLCIEDWIQASDACLQAGQQFHEKLEAISPSHAAGAALLMLPTNPAKAVWHYNQWAAVCFAPLLSLVSVSPLMVACGKVLHGPGLEAI